MQILVINQYFHPDLSATAQLLTECCEDLARVHRVTVVTGRPSYSPSERVDSRGLVSRERHRDVDVLRVWSTSFDRSFLPGRMLNYATYLSTSVVGAFRAHRPDVVMALTDPPLAGLVGGLVARARRVPLVLVTKDIFPETAVRMGLLREGTIARGLRRISSILFDRARTVVSIGRDMTQRLLVLGVPAGKIDMIRDWADGDAVRPLPQPTAFRIEQRWGPELFVVMHSGNVGRSQSLETLVAAADLLRDRDGIVLVIVGEGAAKASLVMDVRRRGLGNVVFLPYQPKDRLAESLGAADVHVIGLRKGLAGFIVPSKLYGILAAGRPFIAATEPGAEPAMIAREHGCGTAIPPDDPRALADAIILLSDMSDDARAAIGQRGRMLFEASFNRDIASSAYRRVLEEAAGHA